MISYNIKPKINIWFHCFDWLNSQWLNRLFSFLFPQEGSENEEEEREEEEEENTDYLTDSNKENETDEENNVRSLMFRWRKIFSHKSWNLLNALRSQSWKQDEWLWMSTPTFQGTDRCFEQTVIYRSLPPKLVSHSEWQRFISWNDWGVDFKICTFCDVDLSPVCRRSPSVAVGWSMWPALRTRTSFRLWIRWCWRTCRYENVNAQNSLPFVYCHVLKDKITVFKSWNNSQVSICTLKCVLLV